MGRALQFSADATGALPVDLPSPAEVDFRELLGERAWAELPAAVQARFRTGAHATPTAYAGAMVVRASAWGALMAHACRAIGTPLAPWTGAQVPVTVEVRHEADGSFVWDRTYAFEGRPPVRVSSRKVRHARLGLMEVVLGGLGMTLAISVEDRAIHFRSTGYFLQAGGAFLAVPLLLTPGHAHVIHADEGGGWFRFTLRFVHPLAGETIFQTGLFRDPAERRLP